MTAVAAPVRARRALLLIDFQRDFLEPNGRLPVCRSHVEPAIAAAKRALAEAHLNGDAILAIGNEFRRQDHLMNLLRRGAGIAGSPGSQWTTDLPLGPIPYLPKWASSAFVNPELDEWLRSHDVGALALSGLKAGACIRATAEDALARGYRVELVADAIACDSDASRRRALTALAAKGAKLCFARQSAPGF